MITPEKLQLLITSHESSTLDFKRKMYDFDNDSNGKKISSYVKDIISFSNTIRTESAFIIIGVGEKDDNSKEYIGLDNLIDEAILQSKVLDKVYPRPLFSFYTIELETIPYGVFEFPVNKYPTPLSANIKLKGIEAGQVYHRKGSTNSNATSLEAIQMNDWLRSLPANPNQSLKIRDNISSYIKRITEKTELLSSIVAELLEKSRKEGNTSLENFCKNELQGLNEVKEERQVEKATFQFNYRAISVYQSLYDIDFGYSDISTIKTNLDQSDKVHTTDIIFNFTLFKLEQYSEDTLKRNGVFKQTVPLSLIFPDKKDTEGILVYRYILPETFKSLLNKISQRLIEELLNL